MAKLRNSADELHTEIRRLTEEVIRLRKELETSTKERAAQGMSDDKGPAPAYRRRKPRSTK